MPNLIISVVVPLSICNGAAGLVVPIPTLPDVSTRIRSAPPVTKFKASLVGLDIPVLVSFEKAKVGAETAPEGACI